MAVYVRPLNVEQELLLADAVRRMDCAMCSPDSEFEELRTRAREVYTSAGQDQLRAAAAHAESVVKAGTVQGVVAAFERVDAASEPTWLRYAVLETVLVWEWGWGMTCQHRPVPARPEPVFSASWWPRTVVCRHCTGVLGRPECYHTVKPCDACGSITTPVRQLGLCCVQTTALTYSFTLCRACLVEYGYQPALS